MDQNELVGGLAERDVLAREEYGMSLAELL